MKYIILISLSLCLSFVATAQAQTFTINIDVVTGLINCNKLTPIIKGHIDSMALPKYSFCEQLKKGMYFPKDELFDCIEGTVLSQFTIDTNGKVKDATIKYGVHKVLDREVLATLNKMPAWKPAMSNGKPVPVSFTLPFEFKGKRRGCPTSDAIYNDALRFYKRGDTEQALNNFKLLAHRNYADVETLWNIAVLYITQNKPQEACPYLKQILDVRGGKNLDDRDVIGLINKCCPNTD